MSKLWSEIARQLGERLGEPVSFQHPAAAGGGCINEAFQVDAGTRHFFVKLNRASRLDMFEAEAEGLAELRRGGLRVPEPWLAGTAAGKAFLVMEYLPLGGAACSVALGHGLAAQHRVTAKRYGWHRDNTIGSTPQPNDWMDDWCEFWAERRLGFQLELARGNGAGRALDRLGERVLERLPQLLDGHEPEPSLLHGDLWGGNAACTREGEAVVYDPAVYFGDREADLAMTELFGGFGADFRAAYEEAWPLEAGYAVRRTLYNCYHILNHFNMFGGGYLSQALGMMERLLAELG